MTAEPSRPLGMRGGLRRLSTGLLAYGVDRADRRAARTGRPDLGERPHRRARRSNGRAGRRGHRDARRHVDRAEGRRDDRRLVLVHVEGPPRRVDQAAEAVRAVQPRLADLEAQFRSINILGNQPLAGAADMVAGIAPGISRPRRPARPDRRQPGRQRGRAGAEPTIARRARRARRDAGGPPSSGGIDQGLATCRRSSRSAARLCAWAAVPAVGALVFGIWLRRELGRTGDDGSAQLVA